MYLSKPQKKKKKERNKTYKTSGFHYVLVKLMHHSSLMAGVAVLSELSKRWVEISDEILVFVCFILASYCSQICILPKSNDAE